VSAAGAKEPSQSKSVTGVAAIVARHSDNPRAAAARLRIKLEQVLASWNKS